MNMEILICESHPEEHPEVPVSAGTYSVHHENWKESQILRCRDCNGKRVPKEKENENENEEDNE